MGWWWWVLIVLGVGFVLYLTAAFVLVSAVFMRLAREESSHGEIQAEP